MVDPRQPTPERDETVETASFGAEGAVLYQPSSRQLLHVNATAALVWDRCDGTATAEHIAVGLADELGQPHEVVRHPLEAQFASLVEARLLKQR